MKKKYPLKSDNQDEIISKDNADIEEIIDLGHKEFKNGKFKESAKKFRQVSSILQGLALRKSEGRKFSERNTLNDLSGKEWLKRTKSWVVIDGRPSDIPKNIKNHPGSFPPALAGHFIEFFTKKGEWVLDPFMGIGSTLEACLNLNRNCLGTELNPNYAEYAEKRIQGRNKDGLHLRVFNEDASALENLWKKLDIPHVDFVITSPPYFNILKKSRGGVESTQKKRIKEGFDETYGDDPRDLGNIHNYEDYLKVLSDIFKNIKKIMREKGYLCIIAQNFRPKDGIMRSLAWDIAYKLKEHFKLRQEFIWLQDQKQLGIWGYPTTFVSNVHHHYCLILQK